MYRSLALLLFVVVAAPSVYAADDAPARTIHRAAGPITIDGDLSDPGWQNALTSETWYETNPGDNIEPKVKTVGYITYDDRFFYAAIHSFDNPADIRAQLGDHDGISGNSDDFAGVILDTRNDGKTAMEFFVNAAGTQYDASQDDASGNEDSSPDLFWDSAVKRTADGWILELRIPFSSLRYQQKSPQIWGIILYRNMPRERRYQIFDHKLPRGSNCFVCNYNKV
ncbi:MAG TPA: carbohydrate binding family 9 domain-containing protein, partial [Thermoanaerobaculia bacterium]